MHAGIVVPSGPIWGWKSTTDGEKKENTGGRERDDRKVHSVLVPDAQATIEGMRQVGR